MNVNNNAIKKGITSVSRVKGGDGMEVSRLGQSACVSAPKKPPTPAPGVAPFAVVFVEEFDNWFTAHRYNWSDGTEGTTLLYVAKAPHLRRDFYENFNDDDPPVQEPIDYPDGTSFLYEYVSENTRTCTDQSIYSEYNETQQITPSYYVGEVIMAMTAQTGLQNGDGASINFVEVTPRMWARKN